MSPIRKQNISLLQGVRFGGNWDYQTWMLATAALSLLLIAGYSLVSVVEDVIEREEYAYPFQYHVEEVSMPNFTTITDTRARKAAFFEFLEPFVQEANQEILAERETILKLQQSYARNQRLSSGRLETLNALLQNYGLQPVGQADARIFEQLLQRADTIPASLALAQAALESGWGTSRFARQGNNLFGIWCYEPGCGIVPRRRPAGRSYEVAAYDSPRDSFYAYLRNLNTNSSYAELREIREAYRARGFEPSGIDLAAGLVRYSQERWDYVEKVRDLIAYNGLEK